jgi:hypothetical protein
MDAAPAQLSETFGTTHFGRCQFGDQRLTERAVTTANAIFEHPAGTLPAKLDASELLGFYRLANNPKVNHANMLAAHRQVTLDEMNSVAGVLLVISDTTEVDFTGIESAHDELGSIGNGGGMGLLCHNVLAVEYTNRRVLGLVNQVIHKRREVRKGEKLRAKRESPHRESRLWKRGLKDIPPAPSGQLRVNLCDRGADTFENMEFWAQAGEKYVIRSKSNRKLSPAEGELGRLHDRVRQLPTAERRTIKVADNNHQTGRQAEVEISFAAVTIPAPKQKRGEHSDEPHSAWVVRVHEINPPKGQPAIEWILLTNVAVETVEQAWERVDWYKCRPIIEEFHKAVKTGCGMELLQFTTAKALMVSMALLSVVATRLLVMRNDSRDETTKDSPATKMIDPIYVEVLSTMRHKAQLPLTVYEFYMALAWMGGHLNRKSDKPPGWLVLWRGWIKLQSMVEAVAADRARRCAQT